MPRPGGSNPSPVPSVPPSRRPSPPLSNPVTDRKPGRVARRLTSVALPAAVSLLHGGLPAALGRRGRTTLRRRRRPRRPRRRCTPCWPRTPPSCLSRRHSYSLLLIIRFAPSLPSFPPFPPSLLPSALQCSSSSQLFSLLLPTAHSTCYSAFLLTRFLVFCTALLKLFK